MGKNTYTPRRCSKRWLDGDCPPEVLCIIDHPKFGDRYTVMYAPLVHGTSYADGWIGYRAMDENPYHPQGIGMWGEMEAYQAAQYRYRNKHRYAKWSELPEKVKQCVVQDCKEFTS